MSLSPHLINQSEIQNSSLMRRNCVHAIRTPEFIVIKYYICSTSSSP